MSYVIITDAAADLDADVAKQAGIKILPMSYSLNKNMRVFSGNMLPEEYIDFYYAQRHGDLTKTTQLNEENFMSAFKPYLKKGESILYISLSSGLSDTFDAALSAKKKLLKEFPDCDIKVVDSLSATGGMGVFVERAIRNREEGRSLEDNYNYLNMMSGHVHIWFYVQDLNYLKRGGRISGVTAFFGTVLNVKPVLRVDHQGKLVNYKNARGSGSARDIIFELFKEHYDGGDDVIYIVDADSRSEANDLADLVSRFNPRGEIRRHTLSPIISAHTGQGMVAICHAGKKSK